MIRPFEITGTPLGLADRLRGLALRAPAVAILVALLALLLLLFAPGAGAAVLAPGAAGTVNDDASGPTPVQPVDPAAAC